jgi:hypothetical protein
MRTDQVLREARRKRDLAQRIRAQAESMMRVRASALRQAEELDGEATGLEVARFKRNKAYCLLRDAPFMPLAKDRARLVLYAKFFEKEAVKLEVRHGDPIAGASDREGKRGAQ